MKKVFVTENTSGFRTSILEHQHIKINASTLPHVTRWTVLLGEGGEWEQRQDAVFKCDIGRVDVLHKINRHANHRAAELPTRQRINSTTQHITSLYQESSTATHHMYINVTVDPYSSLE